MVLKERGIPYAKHLILHIYHRLVSGRRHLMVFPVFRFDKDSLDT
jgi:hypothetical protein